MGCPQYGKFVNRHYISQMSLLGILLLYVCLWYECLRGLDQKGSEESLSEPEFTTGLVGGILAVCVHTFVCFSCL